MSAIWKVVLKLAPLWWAIGLAFGVQLLEFKGWLASPEGILLDFFLADAPFAPSSRPPAPIVTLEIDDIAYDDPDRGCFFYSPMDPRGIQPLINAAFDAGAAVVGVDIITNSPQKDDIHWYEELAREFQDHNIVWAAGGESSSLDERESLWEWLSGPKPIEVRPTAVLGQKNRRFNNKPLPWGLPIYPREEDLHLRRFARQVLLSGPTGVPKGEGTQLNWATQVAKRYCNKVTCNIDETHKELYVSFAGLSGVRRYRVSDLFECKSKAQHNVKVLPKTLDEKYVDFKNVVKKEPAIVLIGGTFPSSRDFYDTPEGPTTPGLLINARVIQAEIAGNGVSEIRGVSGFLLDVLLGLLIALVFGIKDSRLLRILVSLPCIIVALALVLIAVPKVPLWIWLALVVAFAGLYVFWPFPIIEPSGRILRFFMALPFIFGAIVFTVISGVRQLILLVLRTSPVGGLLIAIVLSFLVVALASVYVVWPSHIFSKPSLVEPGSRTLRLCKSLLFLPFIIGGLVFTVNGQVAPWIGEVLKTTSGVSLWIRVVLSLFFLVVVTLAVVYVVWPSRIFSENGRLGSMTIWRRLAISLLFLLFIAGAVAFTALPGLPGMIGPVLLVLVVFDLAIMFVMVLPLEPSSLNLRLFAFFLWIPVALLISAMALYWWSYVWLSCVAVAIGMTLHVIIEIWKENLQLGHERKVEVRIYEQIVLKISEGRVPPPEE